jgi:hypothetical protein
VIIRFPYPEAEPLHIPQDIPVTHLSLPRPTPIHRVVPGILEQLMTAGMEEQKIEFKRYGTPEEIAEAIACL